MKTILAILLFAGIAQAASVDLKVVSLDMSSPLKFDDSFGAGAAFNQVKFTLENKSKVAVKVQALFTIKPADGSGNALTSTVAYMPLAPKQVAKWNMSNSMPVLYGPGKYEIEVCIQAFDGSGYKLKDKKTSNNCKSGKYEFIK